MPDVFLRQGELFPADVRLGAGLFPASGTGSATQIVGDAIGSGAVTTSAITGTGLSVQAQDGAGSGAVSGGSGAAGRGHGRRKRQPVFRTVELALPAVGGTGASRQERQAVYAVGIVVERIGGAGGAAQARQAALGFAQMDTSRRDERDLLEIIALLDAA